MKPPRRAMSRPAGVALAAGVAGSLLLTAAAGASVGARRSARAGTVAVPQGIGAAALGGLRQAGVFNPGATPETVSFILKARNIGSLETKVQAGMPRGYLSVRQFAARYGQSPARIAALEKYLAGYGIAATSLADGLDVTATGTADQFNAALSVTQHSYTVPAAPARDGFPGRPAVRIHGARQTPLLPEAIGRNVLSILGLTNYPSFASLAVRKPALAADVKPAAVQTGSLTPADFAEQYNLTPLYAKGAHGQGTTIGIVTLASLDPADPTYFWNNVLGLHTAASRITLVNVDGGAGPVSAAAGSGETALDVEQSGALAPRAHIVVYQAPNTDYGLVDGFFAAASQNIADSVSASWGESETAIQGAVGSGMESPTYAVSFDEAYLELAAQGQSAFVSAGDYGAYTAAEDIGTANLSAGNPDSSPWATSAGGTTLAGEIPLTSTVSVRIPAQRTWGWDWLWPDYGLFGFTSEAQMAASLPIGGGGGFSAFERTPAYQQVVPSARHFGAVEYLTPANYQRIQGMTLPTAWSFNPAPALTQGWGSGRATPDVSADADPFTGYLLCFQGSLQPGWGGTSFVAPQLNGSTAVIDSLLGHRVGLWNPAIYRFAMRRNSPFTPLGAASTGNDNLYYTGTPGQVYNVGSGLGTPDLTALARDFARR